MESLSPSSSEAVSPTYHLVDLSRPELDQTFQWAPVYVRGSIVRAKPAEPGPLFVHEVTSDGRTELTMTLAGKGDWVVTYPTDAGFPFRCQVSASAFKQYFYPLPPEDAQQLSGTTNTFLEVDFLIRAFRNPLGVPVRADGPEGEGTTGDANCMFAVRILDDGTLTSDRMLVDSDEFKRACLPYEAIFGHPFAVPPVGRRGVIKRLLWLADHIMPKVR